MKVKVSKRQKEQLDKIVPGLHVSQEGISIRTFEIKPKKTLAELIRYVTPMYTAKVCDLQLLNSQPGKMTDRVTRLGPARKM